MTGKKGKSGGKRLGAGRPRVVTQSFEWKPTTGRFAPLQATSLSDTRYRAEYGYGAWDLAQLEAKPSDWDAFYDYVFNNVPKMAAVVTQTAEMAAGFNWVAETEDDPAKKLLDDLIYNPDVLLRVRIIEGFISYQKYGRVFYEPIWSLGKTKLKLKMPDPKSIKPIRDYESDIQTLAQAENGPKNVKAENLGKLIGFIQTLGKRKKFVASSRLIFIPRYPQPDQPDGVSVFRQTYMGVGNKLGIEDSQAKMARRHGDPPRVFSVGNDRVPCRPDKTGQAMIDFTRDRITEAEGGQDLFIPDWVKLVAPEPQNSEMPRAVVQAQRHLEENLVIGAGSFPALLTSEGYRSSASEVRGLLEFKISPIREIFQAYFTNSILKPYLDANLGEGSYKMPIWVWRDITPEDMNAVRQSLSAANQSGWIDANDARRMHGGLTLWPEEKVQQLHEVKQLTKRQDRLEAPHPELTTRVPIRNEQSLKNESATP